jgi:hypothetical protein
MAQMLAQKVCLNFRKSGARRFDLRHDFNAIAVLLYHLGDAPDLTFDPFQCRQRLFGRVCFHADTPMGYLMYP